MLHLEHNFVLCSYLDTSERKDQKYLDSLETKCWKRMEKFSWTNHVKYEYYIQSRIKGTLALPCVLRVQPIAVFYYYHPNAIF
jgi:hypothetical protein